MTTNIRIDAHCGQEKEVEITITEYGKVVEQVILQEGESTYCLVYDCRTIRIKEVVK